MSVRCLLPPLSDWTDKADGHKDDSQGFGNKGKNWFSLIHFPKMQAFRVYPSHSTLQRIGQRSPVIGTPPAGYSNKCRQSLFAARQSSRRWP